MAEFQGVQTSDREALANAFFKAFNNMNVLELVQLTQALEQTFGVTSGAPAQTQVAEKVEAVVEDKPVDIHLTSFKDKIPTVKLMKELLGLGLKEAMDMVNTVPCVVKQQVEKNLAADIVKRLQDLGCVIEAK